MKRFNSLRFSICRRLGALVLAPLLVVLPSWPLFSQTQGVHYIDGASLARTCIGQDGDVTTLDERLRAEGWAELTEVKDVPNVNEIGDSLTPEVLNFLRTVSLTYLLSGNRERELLARARRDLTHDAIFRLDPTDYRDVFYKSGIGLFSMSWSHVERGSESWVRTHCEFVGPWQSEDDRVRWLLPGKHFDATFVYTKRILAEEEQLGPFAGYFLLMRPEGLEALFETEIPRLTIFAIDAHTQKMSH